MEAPRSSRHIDDTSRKAWVETYGCQMNISDGELMQGVLASGGYTLAASPEEADVILVNTCAIREHAEQRVLGRVGELYRIKRDRPDVVIGVTGCMAQRMGQSLLDRAAYVDLVMGPDGYRSLPSVLARLRPGLLPEPSAERDGERTAGQAAGRDVAAPDGNGPCDSPAGSVSVRSAPRAGSVAISGTSNATARVELPVLSPTPAPDTPAPRTPAPGSVWPGTPAQGMPAPGTVSPPGTPAQGTPAVSPPGTASTGSTSPDADVAHAGAHHPSSSATAATRPRGPGRRGHRERLAVIELTQGENYEGVEIRRTAGVSAWVPVQRGCNYRCTYCIVPYVRGSEKNRDPARILEEIRGIAASGITEVTLLGQTVNSWSWAGWTFARLLREVARTDGIRRVRFTSPHPNDLTPDLIEVMATEDAVCRQLHLPVQSGHDRTLRRMLRRYTVESYLEKVAAVRSAMPGIALSTDVIVAFPGETDDEYEATLDLMREVRYDDAFLYKFSERDGTPATRLPREQFIAASVAQSRLERIIELHRGIQSAISASEVGRSVEILVERPARSEGDVMGRTERSKVVAVPGDESLIGRYVRVRLTGTTGATFRGIRIEGTSLREGRVA